MLLQEKQPFRLFPLSLEFSRFSDGSKLNCSPLCRSLLRNHGTKINNSFESCNICELFFVICRKITKKGLKRISPFQSFSLVHLVLFAFWGEKQAKKTVVSVAQLLQVVQVVEVALVNDALPNAMDGVALFDGHTVDTEEDVGGVNEVLHEGDTNLVVPEVVPVLVFVALGNDFGVSLIFVWFPMLGDGGHHLYRVTFIVPVAVVIFWCPNEHAVVVGHRSSPDGVGGGDAE